MYWCRVFAVSAFVVIAIVSNLISWFDRDQPQNSIAANTQDETLLNYPGIVQPQTVSAKDSKLADEEEVIGVCVEEKFRAYRIGSMKSTFSHVINDLIGFTPFSVTYCDQSDCANVFTSETEKTPLALAAAGYHSKKKMMLRLKNRGYFQDTGTAISNTVHKDILKMMKFERTTWLKWKSAHPTTDVFVGS